MKTTGHRIKTPQDCNCKGTIYEERCPCCDWGLCICMVCGGAEGSMPTECPGVKMTGDEERAVLNGKRDYVGGEWVNEANWPRDRSKPPKAKKRVDDVSV